VSLQKATRLSPHAHVLLRHPLSILQEQVAHSNSKQAANRSASKHYTAAAFSNQTVARVAAGRQRRMHAHGLTDVSRQKARPSRRAWQRMGSGGAAPAGAPFS